MDDKLKFKYNFLLESYKNTENTIRFADTKAGAVVAVNVIMLTVIRDHLITIFKFLFGSTLNTWEQTHNALILATIFLVLPYFTFLFISFVNVFKTVQPRWGKIEKNYFTNDIFWIHDINEKRLKTGLDQVKQQFESIEAESLVSDMIYEQAKVADIAVKKMASVECAIKYTKCSFIFWFLIFIIGLVLNGIYV